MSDNFVSRQITKYQTATKLLEFNDSLKLTTNEHYAHIHSGKCKEHDADGMSLISCINIVACDYSNGTGNRMVTAKFNLSPIEMRYLYEMCKNSPQSFSFERQKIIASRKDSDGRSPVSSIKITRLPTDNNGVARNYPWNVQICNGSGIAGKGKSGGSFISKGSYKQTSTVTVSLNDFDMFAQLCAVNSFIDVFEHTFGGELLISGREALENAKLYRQDIAHLAAGV